MATALRAGLLDHVRRCAAAPPDKGASDRQLLERFARQRDERAFALIVERHGPMVLGVGRRVLQHAHDAEDVFQATFLVLARKADTVRKPEALACWLYGVAYRLARRVQGRAARRQAGEQRGAAPEARRDPDLAGLAELRAVLDRELQRLPTRYQTPLVLCYLQGLPHDEAARQLGWSATALKGVLQRAREQLRGRLSRSGLALAPAALVAVLEGQTRAGVPAGWAWATGKAALEFTGDVAAQGMLSAGAASLAREGLRAMSVARWSMTMALAVGLAAVTAGGVGFLQSASAEPPAAVAAVPVRELPPGEILYRMPVKGGERATEVVFSKEVRYVIGTSATGTQMWDVRTGRDVTPPSYADLAASLNPKAISGDGSKVAAVSGGEDKTVRVWDSTDGKLLYRSAVLDMSGSTDALALTPDGRKLAVASEGKVQVWDVATGKLQVAEKHAGVVRSVAFSPDGDKLAIGTDARTAVTLWLLADGGDKGELQKIQYTAKLKTAESALTGVKFTPDGRNLVAEGEEAVVVFETLTTRVRTVFNLKEEVSGTAVSPDGKRLLAASEKGLTLYDIPTGRKLFHWPETLYAKAPLAFSPDGKYAAAGVLGKNGKGEVLLIRVDTIASPPPPDRKLTPEDVERAYRQLGDDDAARAFEAMRALLASPDEAVPALETYLTGGVKEVQARRAVEVLESIGTDAAREVLLKVATSRSAPAPVTQDAQNALRRIDKNQVQKLP